MNLLTGYAIFVLLLTAGSLWLLPQIIAHKKKIDAQNKLDANQRPAIEASRRQGDPGR
jgi:hypothetical protein